MNSPSSPHPVLVRPEEFQRVLMKNGCKLSDCTECNLYPVIHPEKRHDSITFAHLLLF